MSGSASGVSVTHRGFSLVASGSFTITVTGSLTGTCVGSGVIEVHWFGGANMHGSCLFTGTETVGGGSESGTAMISFSGKGSVLGVTANVRMTVNGVHGTGLSNLHGEGSASASGSVQGSFSGTYSLELH